MKKVVLGILSVFMSVCFVSCESDTESIDEVNKLKEFSFARDEFGNFTLKYDVVEGFSSEEYDNFDTGRKEITFNSSSAKSTSMSSDLEMVDSQVKIGFFQVDGDADKFFDRRRGYNIFSNEEKQSFVEELRSLSKQERKVCDEFQDKEKC